MSIDRRLTASCWRKRAAVGLALLAASALAIADEPSQGDPKRGRILFLQCAACHAIGADQQGKIGPALGDIVGRRAGAVPGYAYSQALLAAQLVWTTTDLDRWLSRPQALVPGTTMMLAGIASPAERADLIAYLATLQSDAAAK